MTVDMSKAQTFVYTHGTLFERAVYGWLFEDQPLAHLHDSIRAYKNPDGGYGHGFEHDLRTPDSNPLALEYLLSLLVRFDIPPGDLLDGTPEWVEGMQTREGTLHNPPSTRAYPLAPWWQETGGQHLPDSIVGNLTRLGKVTPTLAERTRAWVQENITPQTIRDNEWLFMAYHAHDYFMNVDDFPHVKEYRAATVENILTCMEQAPENQAYTLFHFVYAPGAPTSRVIPTQLTERALDVLENTQQEDGSWKDQHDLPQWFPATTITNLLMLRRFGRL